MELTQKIIGRQLYLLRTRDTNLSRKQLANILELSENDIIIYEHGRKEIPKELYDKWLSLLLGRNVSEGCK